MDVGVGLMVMGKGGLKGGICEREGRREEWGWRRGLEENKM